MNETFLHKTKYLFSYNISQISDTRIASDKIYHIVFHSGKKFLKVIKCRVNFQNL